jgi:predicted DNA-binding transcriptional regulator AlpA
MANTFQREIPDNLEKTLVNVNSLEKTLATINQKLDEVKLMIKKQNEKQNAMEFLTREEICKLYRFSKATLDRRVADGSIEKIFALGPKSPRYRLVVSASNSNTLN